MTNGIQGVSDKDRWKNRRKMAWLSMFAGIGYAFAARLMPEYVVVNLTGPFYLFLGSILAAYFGFATFDDKWERGNAALDSQ